MYPNLHSMNCLFAQLGLPAEDKHINDFISTHAPLQSGTPLYRASFWTPAQRTFLKEKLIEDADWAAVIDELNLRLS